MNPDQMNLFDNESRPGATIPVESRTPAAQAIMAYFNQVNKGNGINRSRGYSGFDERYQEKSEDVLRGMSQKEERLYGGFLKAVDHLFNVEDLVEAGFSKKEMEQGKHAYTRTLYRYFGPGNAYASDRTKAVNKLRKADSERIKASELRKKDQEE